MPHNLFRNGTYIFLPVMLNKIGPKSVTKIEIGLITSLTGKSI